MFGLVVVEVHGLGTSYSDAPSGWQGPQAVQSIARSVCLHEFPKAPPLD